MERVTISGNGQSYILDPTGRGDGRVTQANFRRESHTLGEQSWTQDVYTFVPQSTDEENYVLRVRLRLGAAARVIPLRTWRILVERSNSGRFVELFYSGINEDITDRIAKYYQSINEFPEGSILLQSVSGNAELPCVQVLNPNGKMVNPMSSQFSDEEFDSNTRDFVIYCLTGATEFTVDNEHNYNIVNLSIEGSDRKVTRIKLVGTKCH